MTRQEAWTIRIGQVAGVPIRLHLTFLLLLALVAFEASAGGQNPIPELVLVISLFASVLLHELGHAWMAFRFGIRTRDIILYPFGGVASLLKEAVPRAELAISAAGPLMNALLALLIAPAVEVPQDPADLASASFATKLFAANVALVVFNLIPAFPMDGGRILRAALALLGVRGSTEIAVRVSQAMSIALGAAALYTTNVFLVLVAAVVFANSVQELVRSRAIEAAGSLTSSDAMTPVGQLITFPHGMTLSKAIDLAVRSFQPIFPIMHMTQLLGFLDRNALLQAATRGEEDQYVAALVNKNFLSCDPDEPISQVTERLTSGGAEVLFVLEQGVLRGIILRDRLLEFLLVQGLRSQRPLDDSENDDLPL